MTTRPDPPPEVMQYKAWLEAGPPPCCHTCDHYDALGYCHAYEMRPPDEFTQQIGQCDMWMQEVPF